jgi:hypothetical protein
MRVQAAEFAPARLVEARAPAKHPAAAQLAVERQAPALTKKVLAVQLKPKRPPQEWRLQERAIFARRKE